ncbi:MAG: hypothetical protein ABL921_06015 [Pirellula sp.]
MSTGTQAPMDKTKQMDEGQKAWLSRVIGGKELYGEDTGLIPKDSDGNVLDLAAIELEVGEFKDGLEPEGMYALEIMEKRQILAQYGIPSIADNSEDFDKKSKEREKALNDLRNLIELQKEEIRNSTDYEVVVQKRMEVFGKEILYGSKTVGTKNKKSEKAYDTEHYKGRVITGPTPQQKKALDAVITQLELLTQRLKDNEDYEFTPQELMNEMWTPLVREGLISEDQCPEEFSRVLQLFKGASALYNKRLEAEARKEVDITKDVRDHLGDISEILGIGAGVADLVLSLVGGQGNVQKILELVTKCAQGGIKTTSALMEKKTNYKDAASSIGDLIGDVVGAAVGGKNGETIGKVAKGAFSGCANLGLFANKLASRDYDDGLDLLADAVGAALGCISDATGNEKLEEAAKHVTKGLKVVMKGGKLAYLLSQEPVDMAAVKSQIKGMAQEALKEAFQDAVDNGLYKQQLKEAEAGLEVLKKSGGEESEQYKEAKAAIDKMKDDQSKNLEGFDTLFDGVFEEGGELSKGFESKVEAKALEKGAEGANQEIMEENDAFNKRLGIAFGMSIGADDEDSVMLEELYSIDSLIAQIERDRATLEMFNMIFDAAGAVLTTFIPQLGGPLKAKAFAMNVVAAAERSYDLITFTSLVDDARKATSPQAPALLAQVDELKRHLTNDTMEAAIAFGQAVALTVAAAGDLTSGAMGTGAVAGVAGRAVSSGLDLFKKSKDLLKKKFEEKKTKQAWEMYKKALSNPKDRQHVMKTFRANPTLAKYCIAFGAIEMDDPIARETLRQVGLNDMVLAQEASSTEKVVMFLEAKFADDIKVEGVVSRFAPDIGDPLTLTIWVKNKEAAASEENPLDQKWSVEKTSAIDAAINDVELLSEETTKNDITKVYRPSQLAPCIELWQKYVDALGKLEVALLSFKPKNVQNQPFQQFQDYLSQLASIANRTLVEANDKIQMQQSVIKSQKTLLESTIQAGNQSVIEVANAISAFGSPEGQTPEKVLSEILNTGPAGALAEKLARLTRESPKLIPHVEFYKHALEFAVRKAGRAINTAEKDPRTANVMASDVVRSLIADAAKCRASLEDEVRNVSSTLEEYKSIKV